MSAMIKFITNPLFLSLVGLIALSVIIWFGGPMLGIGESKPLTSETSRLITILIVTVLWGLNNFRIQSSQKKKDAAMLGDIAQSQPASSMVDPRIEEESKQIQQHFDQALDILKISKKQKHSEHVPIHELPWYIIIGPPGSGKTTALINSGLRFPLADTMGQQPLKGIGGTRNCDWWFSDDAILIDTAGRYTTQDSDESKDSSGWQSFLKLLKKHRPKQPINGAIVAISITELLTQSDTERQEHAHLIKQRLQELYKNLGIQFPVYLIVTKTDLIAGFNEYFDNLSKTDREQIWGMTFPASENYESQFNIQYFKEEFDALLRRLNSRLQWRLHEERDLSRRALILNFPAELSSLKEMVANFLDSVFKPGHFDKPVNVRGVYFTSGTQEGTPIDRVMGAMASNFGLNRQTVPAYSGRGKSFFLTQLFRNVIFPEAILAGTNRIYEQKQSWIRRVCYVFALIAAVGSAGVWTTQYTTINGEIAVLAEFIDDYEVNASQLPEEVENPELLLATLEVLRKASTVVSVEHRGMFSQAGLSQMRSLGPATDEAYERTLLKQYYPSLIALLENSLKQRSTPLEELFIGLKTYLMLADPKRFDKEDVSSWYHNYWETEFAGNATKQSTLKTHLAALFSLDIEPIAANTDLVADARQRLQKIPLSQRIYASLKLSGNKGLQNFFITNVLETHEQQIFVNKSNEDEPIKGVPGLYTKEGYEFFFREESVKQAKAATEDDWVFGKPSKSKKTVVDPDVIHKEIEQLYMQDFIRQWEEFYKSIKLAKFKNFEQGVDMLESLAGANPALMRVIESINYHTDLRSKPNLLQEIGSDKLKKMGKLGKKASKKVKSDIPLTPVAKSLRKYFNPLISLSDTTGGKPPGIQKHLVSLNKLQTYLNEIMVSAEPDEAALQSAIQRMKTNGKDIIGKLRRDSKRIPKPIDTWFRSLTGNSWRVILTNSRNYLNELWANEILSRYDQSIRNRYPIYKSSTQQTSLGDFSEFFAPEGHYMSFLQKYLFPFFKTKGKTWQTKYLEGQSITLPKTTLKQLQRGHALHKAFFPGQAENVNVKFQLTPVKLDAKAKRIVLKFDNEEIVYRHGPPRPSNYSWPFSDEPESSQVSIQFHSGSQKPELKKKGTWAFFQLLDESNIRNAGLADKFNISFDIRGLTAKYSLKANSVNNPFNLAELHSFRLPKKL